MTKKDPDLQLFMKRAYDPPSPDDGLRILVDRLWPRGVSKESLALDDWQKDLAPSAELRRWYNHDQPKWDDFVKRYHAELDHKPDVVAQLIELCTKMPVTLIYAARSTTYNNAVALKIYLQSRSGAAPGSK